MLETTLKNTLGKHVRVNTSNKTVELYDDYGVKIVLRNLTDEEYQDYLDNFKKY